MLRNILNSTQKQTSRLVKGALALLPLTDALQIPFKQAGKAYAVVADQIFDTDYNAMTDAVSDNICNITSDSSYKGIYHLLNNLPQIRLPFTETLDTLYNVQGGLDVEGIDSDVLACFQNAISESYAAIRSDEVMEGLPWALGIGGSIALVIVLLKCCNYYYGKESYERRIPVAAANNGERPTAEYREVTDEEAPAVSVNISAANELSELQSGSMFKIIVTNPDGDETLAATATRTKRM